MWLSGITASLPPLPRQLVSGLTVLRAIILNADSYNVTPFHVQLYKHLATPLPPHKLSRLIARSFKLHLSRELRYQARSFLRSRLMNIPWLGHSSSSTFDVLRITPIKVVPSCTRLAILRWFIDSEPDLHLRLRPHLNIPYSPTNKNTPGPPAEDLR